MALVNSTMLPLGTPAPDFALLDPRAGQERCLADVLGEKGLALAFLSNHCPYVQHVLAGYVQLMNTSVKRGLGAVAIGSNAVSTHPMDGPEAMAQLAISAGFAFPYLHDADQSVAKAYRAACTPDFYLFDERGLLVYRGRMDGARPGQETPVTGAELGAAIDALLEGQAVAEEQHPSIGCNLKWTPGQEPEWF